jgi:hypothetical protein
MTDILHSDPPGSVLPQPAPSRDRLRVQDIISYQTVEVDQWFEEHLDDYMTHDEKRTSWTKNLLPEFLSHFGIADIDIAALGCTLKRGKPFTMQDLSEVCFFLRVVLISLTLPTRRHSIGGFRI